MLARDGVGFSLHDTILTPAPRPRWVRATTSRRCTASRGRARSGPRRPATTTPSRPGTMYVLDGHERHRLTAETDLRMVCVFNPPVTGEEVHDENGAYPLLTEARIMTIAAVEEVATDRDLTSRTPPGHRARAGDHRPPRPRRVGLRAGRAARRRPARRLRAGRLPVARAPWSSVEEASRAADRERTGSLDDPASTRRRAHRSPSRDSDDRALGLRGAPHLTRRFAAAWRPIPASAGTPARSSAPTSTSTRPA